MQVTRRERLDQSAGHLRSLAALAGAGDSACFGNAIFVPAAPAAAGTSPPAWRAELHALHRDGVWIGASPLRADAGWSIKFVTPDGVLLRRTLADIRRILSAAAPRLTCDARKL